MANTARTQAGLKTGANKNVAPMYRENGFGPATPVVQEHTKSFAEIAGVTAMRTLPKGSGPDAAGNAYGAAMDRTAKSFKKKK